MQGRLIVGVVPVGVNLRAARFAATFASRQLSLHGNFRFTATFASRQLSLRDNFRLPITSAARCPLVAWASNCAKSLGSSGSLDPKDFAFAREESQGALSMPKDHPDARMLELGGLQVGGCLKRNRS